MLVFISIAFIAISIANAHDESIIPQEIPQYNRPSTMITLVQLLNMTDFEIMQLKNATDHLNFTESQSIIDDRIDQLPTDEQRVIARLLLSKYGPSQSLINASAALTR
jgi:hypothetical protein